MDPAREPFSLGDWQVDAAGNRLMRGSEVRPLRHKAMALLVLLARRPGETVTRDEIVTAVWDGNSFVAAKAINTAVWAIRQALGDEPEAPRYLETIAKKGYRLIAPVQALPPAQPAWAVPPVPPAPAAAPPLTAGPAMRAGAEPAPRPTLAHDGADHSAQHSAQHSAPHSAHSTARRTAHRPKLGWPAVTVLALVLLLAIAAFNWPAWQRGHAPSQALLTATPLTQNPGHEYLGQLSPDGRQLAFAWWQGQGVGQLYLRSAGDLAEAPRQVSGDAGEVQGMAWAPDGQALAFVASTGEGRCGLWLYTLASDSRRELGRCVALFTPSVDWSPDGRWIAFSGQAEGAGGLFLVAPDGSGLRRLTTAPPAAVPDHQPAWSPDGQRLAFARQDPADGSRDLFEVTLAGEVQRLSSLRLHLLHGITYLADGRDLVFSTTRQDARVLLRWDRTAAQAVPLGLEGSAPARSADGRLVYSLLRSHVSVARLAWAPGGEGVPERLITSVATDRSADIDPHTSRTAFISRRSGQPELWLADAAGQQARALTRLGAVVAAPAWSPRSGELAFLGHCGPGGRFGLCLVDAATSRVRALAADAAGYGRPAWHPGGAEVWVASDRGGRWQLWRIAVGGAGEPVTVDTELPPGRAVQWLDDGSGLVYQPRFNGTLRWRPAGGGAERVVASAAAGETLVDWRLADGSVVMLLRGTRERFVRLALAGGPATVLSEHPLGSFPELASFALAADGSARVDISNTAVADLMQAR